MKVRYVPKGSTKVTFKDVPKAEVYVFDVVGRPYAIGYHGKAAKPSFYHRFPDSPTREQFVKNWLNGLKKVDEYKNKVKAERKAKERSAKVGDIYVCSWGYDQTNVDFYQVVELVGEKSAKVRPIAGESEVRPGYSDMSDHVKPVKDAFKGDAFTVRITDGFKLSSYQYARPVEGDRSYYRSWYA